MILLVLHNFLEQFTHVIDLNVKTFVTFTLFIVYS
jgi:hypothetical protein